MNRTRYNLNSTSAIILFALFVLGVIGWFLNIGALVKLGVSDLPFELTYMFVLRIIGIFVAPLGGLIGWF